MLNYAIEFHIAGDFKEALLLYDDFLRRFPSHPEGLKLKGKLLADTGEAAEGETLLRHALKLEPDDLSTRLYLAEALSAQDKLDEAINAYEELLRRNPDDTDLHYPLALLYLEREEPHSVVSHIEKTLAVTPLHYDALNTLGIARQQLNLLEEAETHFRDAIILSPDRVEAHINLGNLLAERQQFREGVTALNRALEIEPDHTDALFNLAYLWQMAGERPLAIAGYRYLLNLVPDLVDAMNNLGLVLEASGEMEEALSWYEKAFQIDPNNTQTLFNLGNIHQYYQQQERALEFYRRALEGHPENVSAQFLVNAIEGVEESAAPKKYVQDLFDGFAHEFENCLLNELGYVTPALLYQQLTTHFPNQRYAQTLDLGCGTGLMGVELAPLSEKLTGVDLSPRMLDQARVKEIYHTLVHHNIIDFLEENKQPFDLIVCADVLVYLGDLEKAIALMAERLTEGGVLLFSTELLEEDGFKLFENARFKHGQRYITELLESSALEIIDIKIDTIRLEKGAPVVGGCYLATRSSANGS